MSIAAATAMILPTILVVGCIALQVMFSRSPGPWVGLILPVVSLLFSLLITANVYRHGFTSSAMGALPLAVIFVFCNVPTLVFLGIYLFSRLKRRRLARQLEQRESKPD